MTGGAAAGSGLIVATPAHAAAFAEIHRLSFDDGWSAAGFGRMLRQPDMLGLAALDAGDAAGVSGFIICRFAAPEAEIVTLAVLPARRRRGIAGRLMAGAEEFLRRSAIKEWFLEVDAGDPAATALYETTGFKGVGTRAGYYRSNAGRRDALIMRKELGSGLD